MKISGDKGIYINAKYKNMGNKIVCENGIIQGGEEGRRVEVKKGSYIYVNKKRGKYNPVVYTHNAKFLKSLSQNGTPPRAKGDEAMGHGGLKYSK